MTTLVDRVAGLLEDRTSRRGFLARAAVVGSALTVGPVRFLTRPGTAYASVCGTDAACSTGYTVFCVTINNGVNRCPPGSLVGGWWKSDGSGFCCGGARYYIDCHSYCSCGCGTGVHFCGEGCRNCSGGCGPSGQCDQRRVCANEFRYGQCNQDVSCTGPVWCRVVTCTPPWSIPAWKCTTTSATDQRTNEHSAPGLEDCTAIGSRYTSLGGQHGFLGEPRTPETVVAGGRRTLYDGGGLWWTPATGAHEVHGAIVGTYLAVGAETGGLGFPTTDELPTGDGVGRFNGFQNGSIVWTPATGAWSVQGAIAQRWSLLGSQTSPLGFPVTNELPTADGVGRFNGFQNGSIVWSPTTGAWSVQGAIAQRWSVLGSQAGPLGYPLTDELTTPDRVGRYNRFQNGAIYWSPRTGAWSVQGAIQGRWLALGAEAGRLGYPLTDELPAGGGAGRRNEFEHGTVAWSPATGAWGVVGPVQDRWVALGREGGVLGFPTADEQAAPGGGGGRYSEFVGGSVYWSAATGAHSVTGPIRTAWLARSGSAGPLGLPTTEPRPLPDGTVRQDFQGGSAVLDPATGTVMITLG